MTTLQKSIFTIKILVYERSNNLCKTVPKSEKKRDSKCRFFFERNHKAFFKKESSEKMNYFGNN